MMEYQQTKAELNKEGDKLRETLAQSISLYFDETYNPQDVDKAILGRRM